MTKLPLPKHYISFQQEHPKIFEAFDKLGQVTAESGPLSKREIELVKLGMAIGGRMEGAVHSHCRRALEAGITPEEIEHVGLLSITTIGFPSMMANLSWLRDILDQYADKRG